jgi:hypothetical protein
MKIKMISLLSTMLISTTAFAANQKLNNYEEIKDKLMNGASVKVTINLTQDCSLAKGELRSDSSEIFGISISKYAIEGKTKTIEATANFLNSADMGPFGVAAYSLAGVNISTDNSVVVETSIMSVPEYKTLKYSRYNCKMSTSDNAAGVKFFTS